MTPQASQPTIPFTIILAAHQTAPYLPQALDSIAGQTFRDFEALCYVEESTDDSLAICRRMAEKDRRFRVIPAPKSGAVATTRNYGIDHAAGTYLVVLDGDDWLAPQMLEKLAAKLRTTGELDVLSFAAVTTESDSVDWHNPQRLTNFRPEDEQEVFTGLEAIRRSARNGGRFHSQTVLSIYRTAFLRDNKLHQQDGRLMEDFEWTPRVWFHARRVAYLDESFYAYRRRPGSLTTEGSSRILHDLVRNVRSLEEFAEAQPVPQDIFAAWSNQWLATLYWFLFHPVTSRKVTDDDRRKALAALLEGKGKAAFRRLTSAASAPRRLAAPLLSWAARGWLLPAKLFFQKLYYPLVLRRR